MKFSEYFKKEYKNVFNYNDYTILSYAMACVIAIILFSAFITGDLGRILFILVASVSLIAVSVTIVAFLILILFVYINYRREGGN